MIHLIYFAYISIRLYGQKTAFFFFFKMSVVSQRLDLCAYVCLCVIVCVTENRIVSRLDTATHKHHYTHTHTHTTLCCKKEERLYRGGNEGKGPGRETMYLLRRRSKILFLPQINVGIVNKFYNI